MSCLLCGGRIEEGARGKQEEKFELFERGDHGDWRQSTLACLTSFRWTLRQSLL